MFGERRGFNLSGQETENVEKLEQDSSPKHTAKITQEVLAGPSQSPAFEIYGGCCNFRVRGRDPRGLVELKMIC